IRKSRDDLDRRVHARTRELLNANLQLEVEIANRQRVQVELQQTNAMLASVIEAGPLGICAFNLDGTLRKSNAAAATLFLPGNRELRHIVERAARGEHITGLELQYPSQDKELYLSVWASPIVSPDGSVDGVVLMAADLSDRKALELQIRQAQKLESLGVLAG